MDKANSREIVEIEASNAGIVIQAEQQEIANQADVDNANIVLNHITKQMKTIEEKRKTFTQPLNQSLREINSTFKKLVEPLKSAREILRDKVMDWRRKEQEKIRIEQERIMKEEQRRRKIQEAHKDRGHEVSEPVVMTKPEPLKKTDSTQIRKDWKFDILDSTKIPREYLLANETKIRQAIWNGVREIPGVRIYQKETMVNR